MDKETAKVRYYLEIEMYGDEQPSDEQFEAAVNALTEKLPGECAYYGTHSICTDHIHHIQHIDAKTRAQKLKINRAKMLQHHGHSNKEIADAMGLPEGTVRTLLNHVD